MTTSVLKQGHLTDKSNDRVGHLNTILAQEGGGGVERSNLQKFKCPGFACKEEGGVLVSN